MYAIKYPSLKGYILQARVSISERKEKKEGGERATKERERVKLSTCYQIVYCHRKNEALNNPYFNSLHIKIF